jgi:hypothetical protein
MNAQSLTWETFENIKVLRVWQISSKDAYPQIALAQVSDQDFQKFIQDPATLLKFVNQYKIFDVDVRTASPWASLMSTNDAVAPSQWLLTFSHSKASFMAIASQPLT